MTLERGQKGKLFTGARARFSVEGKIVGYARDVTGSEEIAYEAIEVLDNVRVEEHVPVGYSVRLTASMFRIVGSTLKSNGLFPTNGPDPQTHLFNILVNGELNAQIEDVRTGKIIAQFTEVKVASHNFSISARGVVGEDAEFVAIAMQDESEITGVII